MNHPAMIAEPGNHVAVFYQTSQERLELLTTYFSEGIVNNEMCLYVAQGEPENIIEQFEKLGFNIRPFIKSGQFRLFEMTSTYLPDGQFMTDYMFRNVSSYIEAAKSEGYEGLRTAGEMSWLEGHQESALESVIYENAVNLLGDGTKAFTGTCLYPLNEDSTLLIEGALKTHPAFFYDGVLRTNPDYVSHHHDGLVRALDRTSLSVESLASIKKRLASAEAV